MHPIHIIKKLKHKNGSFITTKKDPSMHGFGIISIKKIVSKEYELHFPHPGWSEQKPEDWYSQSMEGIKELIERM